MTPDYEWTLAEPRALARFVNEDDLVAPLTFPAELSRVDTQASGGASARSHCTAQKNTIPDIRLAG